MRGKQKKVSFNGKFFDNLDPYILRKLTEKLTDDELMEFIKTIQKYRIDFVIVKDLIKDRNDMRYCYNKLKTQLEENGIKPCIDYYRLNEGDK